MLRFDAESSHSQPILCCSESLFPRLFGHEKGEFTGAIAQKIGRFEIADTGTVFLDEIGDIPLPLQPKLLRVLQEQEFERLGSGRTHHVNVRVVTATHRNLWEMVSRREFRGDLYYRLNVFPVALPPLQERRQDIPKLVWHFVEICARRMGKRIDCMSKETLEALTSYPWPGNVRELQNVIERAAILSNDGVLPNPLPTPDQNATMPVAAQRTFRDSQRALILQALDATGWVIGGGTGSAARLGLKRTTLISKMKKLGISRPTRPSYANQPSDKRQNEQSDEQAGSAHLASSSGAHDDCQRRKKECRPVKKIIH